ncbi:helix-turn-helix domain-containing protein [Rhizobium sp.]|uniref:helix-turn-helix domain-containing protein n=1 Tax=Rhizobium sp. TaxID=391 RepID=UPI003F818110
MARPESEPKTALAARLRALRKAIGDPDRDEVASKIGVGKSTLASYERGESEPSASALAAYKNVFGANVLWIVSGEGEMFADPAHGPAPNRQMDPELLEIMYKNIEMVHRAANLKTPPHKLAVLAAEMYNELLGRVVDVRDKAIVNAVIPVLGDELEERVKEAMRKPGTGKRSAS